MLNLNLKNSKSYGNFSVSLCITYFLAEDYIVLLPSGDIGKYDLVIEKNGLFQKIQCKWVSFVTKKQGYPQVSLMVSGAVKKNNGGVAKHTSYKYRQKDFDFLWVTTLESCYLIPSSEIFRFRKELVSITLSPRWDKFRVSVPTPFPSGQTPVNRASPRLTTSDKALIKRLRKEGKSQQEVANILGVTRSCVSVFELRISKK